MTTIECPTATHTPRWSWRRADVGRLLVVGGLFTCAPFGAGCGHAPPQAPPPMLVADPAPAEGGPPGAGVADYDRGVAMIEKQAYAEAIPYLDKAIAAQPNNAEAVYYRALASDQLGKREEAISGYQKAISLDDKLSVARVNLAAIYLEEPVQAQKAVAVLKPALEIDPKAPDIRENLAFAYATLGDVDKAAAQYEAALAIKPATRIHFAYAELLFGAKRLDDAAAQYQKALPGYAKDLKHTVFVAHRLAKSKAYDACVGAFTSAIALKGDEPGFYLHRGLCRHELKQEEEARADYRKAIEINDKFQPAYYFLGVSYSAAKKRGKAQWALNKALEINRTNWAGKKAAEQLKRLK